MIDEGVCSTSCVRDTDRAGSLLNVRLKWSSFVFAGRCGGISRNIYGLFKNTYFRFDVPDLEGAGLRDGQGQLRLLRQRQIPHRSPRLDGRFVFVRSLFVPHFPFILIRFRFWMTMPCLRGLSVGFVAVALIFDVCVWIQCKDLVLYPKKKDDQKSQSLNGAT